MQRNRKGRTHKRTINTVRPNVVNPIPSLTRKIEKNISELQSVQKSLKDGQDLILHRLDNVSANGNRGLEASLKDIYNKHTEMHSDIKVLSTTVNSVLEYTKPSRDKQQWIAITKEILKNSNVAAVLSSKLGRMIVFVILVLLVNTVLQSFGVEWDLRTLLKTFIG